MSFELCARLTPALGPLTHVAKFVGANTGYLMQINPDSGVWSQLVAVPFTAGPPNFPWGFDVEPDRPGA